MMQPWMKGHRTGIAVMLAVALLGRILGIGSRPIWYDEAFSVLFSEKGFANMLIGTLTPTPAGAADIHPLGYYTLLWGWMRVFGESPIAVRMLSVIAGVTLVGVVYALTRELFGHRAALVAGTLAALSPFQIHYAQEIRMYVFMSLALLGATYCYWRGAKTHSWKWWIVFSVIAALAQYSHNLAAFYLVALALWPLFTRNWKTLKEVCLAGLLAVLLYLPWLIHLPSQFAKVSQAYWLDKPQPYRIFTVLLVFVTNLPLPAKYLFSQWKPVFLERALLPSGAIFLIWLAWAFTETPLPRPIQVVALLLLLVGFVLGIYEHVTFSGFPYAPYSVMDGYLRAHEQPGDTIIHSNKLSMLPSVYYDRRLVQSYVGDPPGSSQDTLALSTQQVLTLIAQPDIQSAVGNAARVWFIIFDQSNQEYIQAGSPMHPQLAWLMNHDSLVEVQNWGDLRVYLFATRR